MVRPRTEAPPAASAPGNDGPNRLGAAAEPVPTLPQHDRKERGMRWGSALAALAAAGLTSFGLARASGPPIAAASSHREAPVIADDPAADNTDLYAFRSP